MVQSDFHFGDGKRVAGESEDRNLPYWKLATWGNLRTPAGSNTCLHRHRTGLGYPLYLCSPRSPHPHLHHLSFVANFGGIHISVAVL